MSITLGSSESFSFAKRWHNNASLDPSQNVSDRYRAKKIVTDEGVNLVGTVTTNLNGHFVILKSDGVKVNVKPDQIDEINDHDQSSMPEGLLDKMSLKDIGELFDVSESRICQMRSE